MPEEGSDAEALLAEQRRSQRDADPWYYGTPLLQVIIVVKIAFYWLATLPLVFWAFLRTFLIYILLFTVLFIPLLIYLVVGFFLLLTSLYWTPAVSVALTVLAPLMAAAISMGVFFLNLGWVLLIILVTAWDIVVPVFVPLFVYIFHLFITVVTKIITALTGPELTALFAKLLDIAAWFADVTVSFLETLVKVLPQSLQLMARAIKPLLLLFFSAAQWLFIALRFLLVTFFSTYPAIHVAVQRLVHYFRHLLRSDVRSGPSDSPHYQGGVNEYFNALVESGSVVDWDSAEATFAEIKAAQAGMIDYSGMMDSMDVAPAHKRRRGVELPTSRGSLYERRMEDNTSSHHHQRDSALIYSHEERGYIFGAALRDGLHAVFDIAAPLHVHIAMIQEAVDQVAKRALDYPSAYHALRDYNQRYGHPMMLLLTHTPDIANSAIGRFLRSTNPDDDANTGEFWHDWRRNGYQKVRDHPNEAAANAEIERYQPEIMERNRRYMQQVRGGVVVQAPDTGLPSGDIPLPFEMPVVLGSNCFRSKPKFPWCIPIPKNRKFRAPDLIIPTNLPDADTCRGFIAPPDPNKGLFVALLKMLNPVTVAVNTFTFFRYVLSGVAGIFYAINQQTVSSTWIGWFFDFFTIGNSADGPIQTEELFCLFPFAVFPWIALGAPILLVLLLPALWGLYSLIRYLILPCYKMGRLKTSVVRYSRSAGDRLTIEKTHTVSDVARQRWQRDRAIMTTDSGDAVGAYEHLRSLRFDEEFIKSNVNNIGDLHRLYEVTERITKLEKRHREAHLNLYTAVHVAQRLGALSPHVTARTNALQHMSTIAQSYAQHAHTPHPDESDNQRARNIQGAVLQTHSSTLAHFQDELRNMEVELGHRPAEDAVPVAYWEPE